MAHTFAKEEHYVSPQAYLYKVCKLKPESSSDLDPCKRLAARVCDHDERTQSLNVIAEHKVRALYLYMCKYYKKCLKLLIML